METATKRLVRLLSEYLFVSPDAPHMSFDALTSDDLDNETETLRDLVKMAAKENV